MCKQWVERILILPADGIIDGSIDQPSTQVVNLTNKRLRLPLTKTAARRLSALLARFSLAFGGGKSAAVADLEPPEPDETGQPVSSLQRQGILDDLDENAFANSR